MAVEDGNLYLPDSEIITQAFQLVASKHPHIGNTIDRVMQAPWEQVVLATGDFFTAGVAYLANRGSDPYLQEVGTSTWYAVNQEKVNPILTDNMIGAAIQLGVPPHLALTVEYPQGEPFVLFAASNLSKTRAFVLMPPEFIVKAQNRPIEALATMSWISSQIRDLVNGRLLVDQKNFSARAEATEAHFLLSALKLHPDTKLGPVYLSVMKKYPEGISSLDPSVRY